VVDGDEPGTDEMLDHGRRVLVGHVDVVPADPAPRVRRAVTERGEPGEQAPGQFLTVAVQLPVRRLGGVGEGAVDAASGLVADQGQAVAAPPSPGLEQRVRQQRQHADAAVRVGHQLGQQGALQRQLFLDSGLGDGATQLLHAHRPDRYLGIVEGANELGVSRAMSVEVRSYADHHPTPAVLGAGGGDQCLNESAAFVGVRTQREDLLELVHDDKDLAVRRRRIGHLPHDPVQASSVVHQLAAQVTWCLSDQHRQPQGALLERMRPWREHHDGAVAVRCVPTRYQTGAQHRRLPSAGGAKDSDEPVTCQTTHQVSDQLLAPEEAVRVGRLERRQTYIRRHRILGTGRGLAGRAGRELGRQRVPATLPMLGVAAARAYVGQRHAEAGQPPSTRRSGEGRR
jgi:hypothetical protein